MRYFQYIKEYGLRNFILGCTGRVIKKINLSKKTILKFDNYKHKIYQKYLYKKYNYLIDSELILPRQSIEKKIFVFWWQGEENAPKIVKSCINSIRQKNRMEVVVISEKNYSEYVCLPNYIIQKVHEGKIGLAHFSDILRFNLLFYYGGVWLDATDYLFEEIPDEVFKYSFYSLKSAFENGLGWKWTSFYMVAKQYDYLCGKMVEFYNEYWKDHICPLTYLILDCWLTVLYKYDWKIKAEIDAYPRDQMNVFSLICSMEQEFTQTKIDDIKKDAYIHKVTYKTDFLENINGKMTVYGYIVQNI